MQQSASEVQLLAAGRQQLQAPAVQLAALMHVTVQLLHRPPLEPHAAVAVPARHTPAPLATWQQPPLHGVVMPAMPQVVVQL